MKVIYKIWLESEGGTAFGEGPYRLLKGVLETGSLWKAAAELEMAYSKARRVISCCESNLGFTLINRQAGGVSGGGSEVTPEAIRLMKKYEELRARLSDAIGKTYRKHFGEAAEVLFNKAVVYKRSGKLPE
jgi:molybdate transport system regulatory protein